MIGMEEPYDGYTHELADGGVIEHRLDSFHPDGTLRIWLQPADAPQVETTMTVDEAIMLASTLLRDVCLAKWGQG
jgi:hypothetical protein